MMSRSAFHRVRACWLVLLLVLLLPCTVRSGQAPPLAPDAESGLAEANGIRLSYQSLGQGEPLLLLMGYRGLMTVWDQSLLRGLAEHYRLILCDYRGVGRSTEDGRPFSLELFAEDAAALLEALEVPRAHVLGWSMGGAVAQELALRYPERVGGVILLGPAHDPAPLREALARLDGLSPEEFLAGLFPAAWVARHPEVFAGLPRAGGVVDPGVAARQRRALEEWPGSTERLPGLDKELLLVAGLEDKTTHPDQALVMATLCPRSWLIRFTAGGHWLMYQYGTELAQLVHTFLQAGGAPGVP